MAGIYNDKKWIGQKFNMLTVEEAVKRSDGWSWRVRCECGGETVARPIGCYFWKVCVMWMSQEKQERHSANTRYEPHAAA